MEADIAASSRDLTSGSLHRNIWYLAIPMILEMGVLNVAQVLDTLFLRSSSRLIVLGLIGLYGTFATAGYGVANPLLLIAVISGFGLGNASGTLVGQNLGACKPRRSEQTAWWVGAYAAAYAAFRCAALYLRRPGHRPV